MRQIRIPRTARKPQLPPIDTRTPSGKPLPY
jgi:hypothetical protein